MIVREPPRLYFLGAGLGLRLGLRTGAWGELDQGGVECLLGQQGVGPLPNRRTSMPGFLQDPSPRQPHPAGGWSKIPVQGSHIQLEVGPRSQCKAATSSWRLVQDPSPRQPHPAGGWSKIPVQGSHIQLEVGMLLWPRRNKHVGA